MQHGRRSNSVTGYELPFPTVHGSTRFGALVRRSCEAAKAEAIHFLSPNCGERARRIAARRTSNIS
jgi:hypothetical protein